MYLKDKKIVLELEKSLNLLKKDDPYYEGLREIYLKKRDEFFAKYPWFYLKQKALSYKGDVLDFHSILKDKIVFIKKKSKVNLNINHEKIALLGFKVALKKDRIFISLIGKTLSESEMEEHFFNLLKILEGKETYLSTSKVSSSGSGI